jgi:hypothetical protein
VSLFKAIRVGALLLILVIVAGNHWLGKARLAEWDGPIWITVYPIPADNRPETLAYLRSLEPGTFEGVSTFFSREAKRFGLDLPRAAHFQVAPVPDSLPPAVPDGSSRVAIALWSLEMRWWAWRRLHQDGLPDPDIQVFMLYRSAQGEPQLDRSIGMQKGRYTLVNAFASPGKAARNNFVVAHEVLHVLGASDKYDPASGQPLAPDGLANPKASPLYPQSHAEIMGGAVAISPSEARMPGSLSRSVIGGATAQEIGWLDLSR